MTGITHDVARPWWLAEICCCQCGKRFPRPAGAWHCPHCGFVREQPDKPARTMASPAPRPAPETDDAVAILAALGIRAADARSLVARANKAGVWNCPAL